MYNLFIYDMYSNPASTGMLMMLFRKRLKKEVKEMNAAFKEELEELEALEATEKGLEVTLLKGLYHEINELWILS